VWTTGNPQLPWGIDIAKHFVSGVDYISKFGFNPSVGTTEEQIWAESGTVYVLPTTAQTMTVSSANANDTANGTGARTLYVEGLNGNYDNVNETVSLNGQTAVTLSNTYLRILRAYVVSAGSGGTNAGIIYVGYGTVTTGKPATVQAHLAAGMAQALLGLYTIPKGRNGYLLSLNCRSDGKGEMLVYQRPFGGVFRILQRLQIIDTVDIYFTIPLKFTEKTDIQVRGLAATGKNKMGVSFDMVLE